MPKNIHSKSDPVLRELRIIEKYIDSAYLENDLTRLPFGEAAWYFLAACEDRFIIEAIRSESRPSAFDAHAIIDNMVNIAKQPMQWLRRACEAGGAAPSVPLEKYYDAGQSLVALSGNYMSFESAFSYASWGMLEMSLDGSRIVPAWDVESELQYEAYDRLAHVEVSDRQYPDLAAIREFMAPFVNIKGDSFYYRCDQAVIQSIKKFTRIELDSHFELPSDWVFGGHSLAEYSSVIRILWIISAMHCAARITAAEIGCPGLGYSRALVVYDRAKLVSTIGLSAGIDANTVESIVCDLTYGMRGIREPDPALQPLVELSEGVLGWAPNLFLGLSLERNLLVLLNKMPEGRRAYSVLSSHREGLLREHICSSLSGMGYKFWDGSIPEWGTANDVDLAIYSEADKCCLVLELKSFYAPAEPREIKEKSQEIMRGISQINNRRAMSECDNHAALRRCLGIDDEYSVDWAVASESSIGGAWVQDENVPVIRSSHLIDKILIEKRLNKICDWLRAREYLPVRHKHYKINEFDAAIGRWTLSWYGVEGRHDQFV